MTKRIVFAGGSGKDGRHAVPHLLAKVWSVLNVDLRPFDHPGVNTLIADVTGSGQVFNVLTSHFGFDGFEAPAEPGQHDLCGKYGQHLPRDRSGDEAGCPQGDQRTFSGFKESHIWRD